MCSCPAALFSSSSHLWSEYPWTWGGGCGGVLELMIERLRADEPREKSFIQVRPRQHRDGRHRRHREEEVQGTEHPLTRGKAKPNGPGAEKVKKAYPHMLRIYLPGEYLIQEFSVFRVQGA